MTSVNLIATCTDVTLMTADERWRWKEVVTTCEGNLENTNVTQSLSKAVFLPYFYIDRIEGICQGRPIKIKDCLWLSE
jgi:hypothetical protein